MTVAQIILQFTFIVSCFAKHQIFINHTSSITYGPKRSLQSYSTPELGQTSGNGTLTFHAKEQVEIIVTTYGCTNNALTTGGATYILELSEYDTSSTLLATNNQTFIDNSDGTYSVEFIINQEGSIKYSIYINSSCTACSYYWTNIYLSGDYSYFCNFDDLNRSIGSGVVVDTYSNFVSARIEARIFAPETGTYTIISEHDDGCILKINGTTVINRWAPGIFTTTGYIDLIQFEEYDLILEWYEYNLYSNYRIFWQFGSYSQELVPLIQNWYNYEFLVTTSPVTVTVNAPLCGNGAIDSGEECDDGNEVSNDGCSDTCVNEYCSDGTVNNVNEECDDGNLVSGDGCSNTCIIEFCTDGVVNNINEQCDDGNLMNGDGCTAECVSEYCGDETINNNSEECDDGNAVSGDGCSSSCIIEFCSDGTVNNNNEGCDDGNTVSGDGCSSSCVSEYCGDGLVNNNNEECDDNNTSSDDGCNKACVIEDHSICAAGSLTTSSVCTQCSLGYTHNSDHTKCVENGLNNPYKQILYILKAMVVLGIIFNLLSLIIAGTSVTGLFGFVHCLQMIFILPMIGAHLSNDVTLFLAHLSSSLLTFKYFLPNRLYTNKLIQIDYPQNNSYLRFTDLSSTSSLINLWASIILLLTLAIISVLVLLIYKVTKKYEKSSKLAKLVKLIHKTFIFNIFIIFIIESFVLYCLTCFYEIRYFDSSQNSRIMSGIISIIIACLLVLFILLGFIQWLKAKTPEQYDKVYYLQGYFTGIKKTRWRRLYTTMFLLRRFILVSIVTFFYDLIFEINLSLFLIIQVLYVGAILICRFHIFPVHNINESINEFMYLILLLILTGINKQKDWSEAYKLMYISIILLNSMVFITISLVFLILKCKPLFKKSSKPTTVFPLTPSPQESVKTLTPNSTMQKSKPSSAQPTIKTDSKIDNLTNNDDIFETNGRTISKSSFRKLHEKNQKYNIILSRRNKIW